MDVLTIKPADETVRQSFAAAYNNPDAQAQIMRDGDTVIGEVVYTVTPEEMRFLRFRSEDITLRDFLLRGVLNIGWRRGVKMAVCHLPELRDFLLAEGFEAAGEGAQTEIAAFFSRPCAGCPEK